MSAVLTLENSGLNAVVSCSEAALISGTVSKSEKSSSSSKAVNLFNALCPVE